MQKEERILPLVSLLLIEHFNSIWISDQGGRESIHYGNYYLDLKFCRTVSWIYSSWIVTGFEGDNRGYWIRSRHVYQCFVLQSSKRLAQRETTRWSRMFPGHQILFKMQMQSMKLAQAFSTVRFRFSIFWHVRHDSIAGYMMHCEVTTLPDTRTGQFLLNFKLRYI